MEKGLMFITVIGQDKRGIVAKISNMLYNANINIEDINQKVMQGYFVMTMLVDIEGSKVSHDTIKKALDVIAREMNLSIQMQHEDIFKMMHRV